MDTADRTVQTGMRDLLHIDNELPEIKPMDSMELTALAALWDAPMVYVKQFAEAVNSVASGYFLSWFSDKCAPGQWIALNDHVVQTESGLSAKQWRKVRTYLIDAGILINKRTIQRASLYTLDDTKLEGLLRKHSDTRLLSSISPPLTLNRLHSGVLIDMGLSFKACVLFAYLQQANPVLPVHLREDFGAWILLSDKEVREQTYLSSRELASSSHALLDAGVIEVTVRGMPRYRYGRVNAKRIGELSLHYLQRQQC